jgi:hypothetical protein
VRAGKKSTLDTSQWWLPLNPHAAGPEGGENLIRIEADARSSGQIAAVAGLYARGHQRTRAIPAPSRDYSKEVLVSNEVFQVYKGLYSYDPTPLACTQWSDAMGRDGAELCNCIRPITDSILADNRPITARD